MRLQLAVKLYHRGNVPQRKDSRENLPFCGEIGYKSIDCWEQEENKDKNLKNLTSKMSEVQHTVVEHAFAAGTPFCTVCYKSGHKAKACQRKG